MLDYKNRRVFVTGHTGFKGSWLCKILHGMGAEVTGYALAPSTTPSLFQQANIADNIHSIIGDIRDFDNLSRAISIAHPEFVFHLAAQPLVLDGYRDPRTTYDTNVMGTVNVLECVRQTPSVKSVVNVTTDKVYFNQEWSWGYRETDQLNGYDPYSNSKSCSELVTSSYINSFFGELDIPVSTLRAGNVIGGGDYSDNRIVPDCVRAALGGQAIQLRNPNSIRPYQHVLEPLFAYLLVAAEQEKKHTLAGSYNIGPEDCDCVPTKVLATHFCDTWGDGLTWAAVENQNAPHEANFLKLDCCKIKSSFGWSPVWRIAKAVEKSVEFVKQLEAGITPSKIMEHQIKEYQEDCIYV